MRAHQQKDVQRSVSDRQGRVRQGLEGLAQKDETNLRDEGDEQGQGHQQEVSHLRHERERFPDSAQTPLPSQHDLRLPGPLKSPPHHGLSRRRRPALPSRKQALC